ncbi:MAG: maleylpyruvate isomerase N-terminal domain-containing protein [Candidatus Limnocylindria bacterium]
MADQLLTELDAARDDFLDALEAVDADLVLVHGVVGDWSVRDLVVHVAAWCEHGAGAIDLAEADRGAEFAYSRADTDAMNERFAADGQVLSARDAVSREDAAFTAFRQRVAELEPERLKQRLGNGDTVEAVIRYDGPDHYAEHAEHIRSWFGPDEDDEPDGP